MLHRLTAPFGAKEADGLRAGDSVLLSGVIYTARDAAHKRLTQLLAEGKPLPFPVRDAVIYYVGPTPAKPGRIIGSAGPTTSYRMDAYAPALMDIGLRGMIGKGKRSPEVIEAIKRNHGVYLGAIGGAGALLAGCVRESELVAYEDLGAEAVRRLVVEEMPLTVIIDARGENLYESGRAAYLAARG